MEILNSFAGQSYSIKDRFNAGLVLSGPEVKSCKSSHVNFKGAYCSFNEGSYNFLVIKHLYISPYPPAKREQKKYDPYRSRILLLKKNELRKLHSMAEAPGATIIPTRIFTKNNFVKLEMAVGIGLKKYDKREKLKKREFNRRKARLVAR
jgi:SsrA-binding protein